MADMTKDAESARPAEDARDEDATAADTAADARGKTGKPGTALRASGRALIAIVTTIVVLAGLLAWLLFSTIFAQGAEDAREDAAFAAAAQVKSMFSFDHGTVRDEMAKALDGTTGDFRQQFEDEVNNNVIPNAESNESVVTATVISQGTVDSTRNSATVLVFVNQIMNANTGPKSTFTPSRLLVDMAKVDGVWKVSGLGAI